MFLATFFLPFSLKSIAFYDIVAQNAKENDPVMFQGTNFLWTYITYAPPRANKAAHWQPEETSPEVRGVSVAPQNGLCVQQKFKKKQRSVKLGVLHHNCL